MWKRRPFWPVSLSPPVQLADPGHLLALAKPARAVLAEPWWAVSHTGAEYFGSSQGSLRGLVEGWADGAQLPAVLILDHGPAERAWHVSGHAVLTLSGEGRTADDVIVRDAWYLRHAL